MVGFSLISFRILRIFESFRIKNNLVIWQRVCQVSLISFLHWKKINLQKIFHGMTDDERDKRTPEIITYTWWEINMLME